MSACFQPSFSTRKRVIQHPTERTAPACWLQHTARKNLAARFSSTTSVDQTSAPRAFPTCKRVALEQVMLHFTPSPSVRPSFPDAATSVSPSQLASPPKPQPGQPHAADESSPRQRGISRAFPKASPTEPKPPEPQESMRDFLSFLLPSRRQPTPPATAAAASSSSLPLQHRPGGEDAAVQVRHELALVDAL